MAIVESSSSSIGGAGTSSPSVAPSPETWTVGTQVLHDLLQQSNGVVSSRGLRHALEQRKIPDARRLVVSLKYFDFDAPPEDGRPKPPFRWYSHARSFYTEEQFAKLKNAQDQQATTAEQAVAGPVAEVETEDEDQDVPPKERRRSRQEERRLGTYVVSALESIYQSDHAPEDAPYVFDVHNERAGSEFENVDVMAAHWRSQKVVDLVTVEVKLDFTARLVQQARNYGRFSDRVWIAVPVLAEAADAAGALREFDPCLFEHIVDAGLGVLACRRRPGRSYEVLPVHWPRRLFPDPVEKEAFLERYRPSFEEAGILAPRGGHRYPAFP
ncbi:MAG: hypothetical protein ACLP1X_04570 [Polyangiaceae bacterium]